MNKRVLGLALLAIIVSGAFILGTDRNTDVTVLNARGIPLNDDNTRFMVTFELQNDGPAKTVTGLHSASANMVHFMNPGYGDTPLVIPANSNGIFAMDGAHVMVMGTNSAIAEGASLPLTLEFADAPEVTARVLNVGRETGMNHDMSNGVQSEQNPTITLTALSGFSADGGEISIAVENFTFVRAENDAPHVPNHGHAHIYLNGLKLGRLYDTAFSLGPILPGAYELVVSLNSNTHQPYMNGDVPVQSALSFTISK
ncbi:MAG: copper chaperone PCu(A)C [Litoreibacter sp.]|uniref:copper chaperone PCu(A)C n=1 Tax=Litoreibacter sp. TaxID=1969459 RepID=UPI0032994385